MATIVSHFLIGWGAYRFVDAGRNPRRTGPHVAAWLSVLPDGDSLLLPWIPYGDQWGHRGMTHSLAFAALAGTLAAIWLRSRVTFPGGTLGLAATLAAVTASHGILDALTDGGLGVAFFAPVDATRYFLPVRPIPVSPITLNPFDPWVWRVLAVEAVLLWPWALLLWTARAPAPRWSKWTAGAAAAVSVAVWGVRIAG
jgi:inner membrane protein